MGYIEMITKHWDAGWTNLRVTQELDDKGQRINVGDEYDLKDVNYPVQRCDETNDIFLPRTGFQTLVSDVAWAVFGVPFLTVPTVQAVTHINSAISRAALPNLIASGVEWFGGAIGKISYVSYAPIAAATAGTLVEAAKSLSSRKWSPELTANMCKAAAVTGATAFFNYGVHENASLIVGLGVLAAMSYNPRKVAVWLNWVGEKYGFNPLADCHSLGNWGREQLVKMNVISSRSFPCPSNIEKKGNLTDKVNEGNRFTVEKIEEKKTEEKKDQ